MHGNNLITATAIAILKTLCHIVPGTCISMLLQYIACYIVQYLSVAATRVLNISILESVCDIIALLQYGRSMLLLHNICKSLS